MSHPVLTSRGFDCFVLLMADRVTVVTNLVFTTGAVKSRSKSTRHRPRPSIRRQEDVIRLQL